VGRIWRQIALQRKVTNLVGFRRIGALLKFLVRTLFVVVTYWIESVTYTKFGRRCR
jgi:hypothetical protein